MEATVWHDVTTWGVEGKGWTDTISYFDRLPRHAHGVVPDPVWQLSRHAAGMCVLFESDAPAIHARWTLTEERLAMPHVAASAKSGLDLYARDGEGRWRWVGATRPATFPEVTETLISGMAPRMRSYLLYLPLYNGVTSLHVGVPEGASFRGVPPRTEKTIVYYGTSIAQGASASRPGMAHTAILGRRLDVPVINLGFSGNGRMDLELAHLLGELDAAVYVIDCLPNMRADMVKERAAQFLRILRSARPATPIVLVEDRTHTQSHWLPEWQERHRTSRAALRAAYDALCAEGQRDIVYVEGEDLIGDDGEGTVDGSHPNDLGFVRIADALEPVLRKVLGIG